MFDKHGNVVKSYEQPFKKNNIYSEHFKCFLGCPYVNDPIEKNLNKSYNTKLKHHKYRRNHHKHHSLPRLKLRTVELYTFLMLPSRNLVYSAILQLVSSATPRITT